jgi:hypothetical protein
MSIWAYFKINLHKVIDSIKNYEKDKRKRRDLESIKANEEMAHFSKHVMENEYFEKHFKEKAKITKRNMEKD